MKRIGAVIVGLGGIATIIAAFIAFLQLRQSLNTARAQDSAQSTLIAILEQQLTVYREIATVQSNDLALEPTATEIAKRVEELQNTADALSTMQYEANISFATQFAPTTTPRPICSESGSIPPLPEAPPDGCILIIEWWVKPDPTPCGLLITRDAPSIPSGAIGSWYYVYPSRPDQHIREFQARDIPCEIEDLR